MSTATQPLKMPPELAGGGLKSLLDLLKAGTPSPNALPPVSGDQIAAELAYKLAQAAARANDLDALKAGIAALLGALETITIALSDSK